MKTREILGVFGLALLLLLPPAFAAPPSTTELEGPPIERDTLKKNPNARIQKILDQMQEQNDGKSNVTDANGGTHIVGPDDPHINNPAYILAHLDDYRKMFWDTYPDKPYHEEAREALAQALFIKDIHYLQSDLVMKNFLDQTPSRNADLHQDTPENNVGQAIGQAVSSSAMDASINPDGGIAKSALPEFETWVRSVRQSLGAAGNLETNAQLASLFKTDFGILGADYRKACNFGGKEYQDYLLERDWAEFTAQNRIPAGFDNKQHYGEFLYYRFGQRPIHDAFKIYADMATAMGDRTLLEDAAQKVMNAPKTSGGLLVTHVPEPIKLSPNGTRITDYDMPIPPGVIDVYSDPLVAFELLITRDDDYRYLLYILQHKYFTNRIDIEHQTEWTFSANAAKALFKVFGKQEVLSAAHLVRTATKRLVHGTIMNEKAIGATRNDPLEAFEDILCHKNPKAYVLAALMFNANVESPLSVDADAAYKNLVATSAGGDEQKLLAYAAKMVLDKPNLASRNELDFIKQALSGARSLDKPPESLIPDPDYLAWQKFPDSAKVSYVIRGWNKDPRHPGTFTTPSNPPTIRYTLSIKSRTPRQLVLWDTEISYDYPSGTASRPNDTEVGYNAMRAVSTAPATPTALGRGGAGSRSRTASPAASPAPPAVPVGTDQGDEVLTVAGRSIPTHWISTTRTSGTTANGGVQNTSITKIWTSDQVPGGLVRKTEEVLRSSPLPNSDFWQLRETLLESFQGFTPGDPASPGALPPGPPPPPPGFAPPPAPAAPSPAPAAPRAAAPPARPAPAARRNTPRQRPTAADIAAQRELMKRWSQDSQRSALLTSKIVGQPRQHIAPMTLTPELTRAHTDADTALAAALQAVATRDNAEAVKQLQAAEDNLTILETSIPP